MKAQHKAVSIAGLAAVVLLGHCPRAVAQWECAPQWMPVGAGLTGTNAWVTSFVEFDDGAGRALYAGGQFTDSGGAVLGNVARWNGQSWAAVGSLNGSVYTLAVHDFGAGPALCAGGELVFPGLRPPTAPSV